MASGVLGHDRANSPATSLTQAQIGVGEELRIDDVSGGDLYHGRAPDSTATSDASWEVVRIYRDPVTAIVTRVRYRSGVAWDARAAGW